MAGFVEPRADDSVHSKPNGSLEDIDGQVEKGQYAGLTMASIFDIRSQLTSQNFSSQDLTKTYLKRIEEVNGVVRAVNCVNLDTLTTAELCDQKIHTGAISGTLQGIPILVKDLLWTLDGMDTTAGTLALKGARLGAEASVVKKLRDAGAIILGKANLSEWANFRGTGGWSAIGGKCVGPYVEDQDPQGSSCGSAVAVQLGLSAAAIGTETNMSITSPAERAGIVGLKPTPGLTSRVGVIQTNEFQDTPGPMTSCVFNAALILEVIAGPDPKDFLNDTIPFQEVPKYTQFCVPDALKGKRVAVPTLSIEQSANIDKHTMSCFRNALDVIRSCGAEVVTNATYPQWDVSWSQANVGVNWALLKRNVAQTFECLEGNPQGLHSVADLIEFIKTTPEEEYERWGVFTFEKAQAATLTDDEIQEQVQRRQDMGLDLELLLTNHECDVLVIPSQCRNPSDLGQCPTITVPIGFYPDGTPVEKGKNGVGKAPHVPIRLLFISPKFTEEKLLGFAYAFEQVMRPQLAGIDILHISPSVEVVSTSKGAQL